MALLNTTETPWNNTVTGASWVEASLLPSIFLGACFLVGMPGNGLVIWTILTKFPQRSFTIVLILNLAMADLMVMLTAPFWIYYFVNSWVFGDAMCRLLIYLVYLTVYASVFFITLMSLHRFAVVVLPFASQRWRRPCVIHRTLLTVWILASVFACPTLISASSQNVEGECTDEIYYSDEHRLAVNILETLFAFVIPFAVLSVCYSCVVRRIRTLKHHKEMKTGKLVAAVVGAFFVCWLPYHILNLIIISALLLKYAQPEKAKALLETTEALTNFHGSVAFLSSCLNPILYAFAARSFRGGLRETNFAKLFGKMQQDTEEKSTRDATVSLQAL
ncbi:leukotriene B4 receptor 1-like [Rhineura floridana]|uniref:leukotriene B4 receptor 1-like n=1 Tax=Rhineura floridana TaxID=261503 RepID=UPI002AC813E4|nr:leukotriene B4 receptor 1-like [Rhineura floridana]